MRKLNCVPRPKLWPSSDFALIETLEIRTLFAFANWSSIGPAIAKVPQSAGQLASTSVVNFGTTVYTGPLNVTNTLNRIRANNGPDRTDDGIVYTNPQASGLPVDGTYYEFTVEVANGTDRNFSGTIGSPGPMRILLATGGDCFFTGDHYSTFQAVYIFGSTQTGPTIGGFTATPSSVTTGSSVTFSATNVADTSGTVTAVNFYRETNSTAGYQAGGDTLVGAGTKSGTTWSLASTVTLATGTYTYYAVATDSASTTSAASSTTVAVTGVATGGVLLAWDVNGQTNFGTQGLGATLVATGVTNSLGLTRSSALTTTGSAAANTWGAAGFSTTTEAAGISGNQFITFGLTVSSGTAASLSSIDMNYRVSSSGPTHEIFQYQLSGGSWIDIPSSDVAITGTSTIPEINLTSVSALQSIAAGTTVDFRIVPYSAGAAGGTWYINNGTGNDLVVNGTSSVGKTPLVLTGPTNYIHGDGTNVSVWNNSTATGSPTVYALANISTMSFAGTSANDSLTIDYSTGMPLVATGLSFNGGTGINALNIVGTAGADTLSVNANTATFTAAFGSASVTYSNASAMTFTSGTGADVLTQTAQPGGGAQLSFIDNDESDTLNVNGGTYTIAAPAAGVGIVSESFAAVSINAGAKLLLAAPSAHADRNVLVAGSVSIAGTTGAWTGQLDLAGNDLIILNQPIATIADEVITGANVPAFNWTGQGIIDSTASPAAGTTLGFANGITGTFDGEDVVATDVLVKHTLFGDADLSGAVNGNDYTQIDNAYNSTGLTGWQNGDFNYDNHIDGSDYSLIDNMFNRQPPTPLGSVAAASAEVAKVSILQAPVVMMGSFFDGFAGDSFSEIGDLWRKKK